MGNYRTLLKKMTVTPAMLIYLDGSWSTIEGPNENYSRELQELFTIGQPLVTEQNVRNGALGAGRLARGLGARRPPRSSTSAWASLRSNQKVRFLGKQVYRYNEVVDAVCDHPRHAPLHRRQALVPARGHQAVRRQAGRAGHDVPRSQPQQPHAWWRRSCATRCSSRSASRRPRYPVEWVIAAMTAMGMGTDRQRRWTSCGRWATCRSIRPRWRAGPRACAG